MGESGYSEMLGLSIRLLQCQSQRRLLLTHLYGYEQWRIKRHHGSRALIDGLAKLCIYMLLKDLF